MDEPGVRTCSEYLAVEGTQVTNSQTNGNNATVFAHIRLRTLLNLPYMSYAMQECVGAEYGYNTSVVPKGSIIEFDKALPLVKFDNGRWGCTLQTFHFMGTGVDNLRISGP